MPDQTVTGFTATITPLMDKKKGLDDVNGKKSTVTVAGTGFADGLEVFVWNTINGPDKDPTWKGTLSGGASPQNVTVHCTNHTGSTGDHTGDISDVSVTVGDSDTFNPPQTVNEGPPPSR